MSILFNLLFSAVPVIFLVGSVVLAVKAVSRGKSRKRTLLMQLASFAAVFALCVIFPIVANAAGDASAAADASGMKYIAAAAAPCWTLPKKKFCNTSPVWGKTM